MLLKLVNIQGQKGAIKRDNDNVMTDCFASDFTTEDVTVKPIANLLSLDNKNCWLAKWNAIGKSVRKPASQSKMP